MSRPAPGAASRPARGPLAALLRVLSGIEAHEARAVLASFALVFVLMAAYYILKPVRDAMASDWSDAQVSWLWTINLFLTFALNLLYGLALSLLRLRVVVPALYGLFALSFGAYAVLDSASGPARAALLQQTFYVWVSVFSLFHVSVFWSFMADLYGRDQAKRTFGFIAAGASAGGLVGPLLPLALASRLGNPALVGVAALLLILALPLIVWLGRTGAMLLQGGASVGAAGGAPATGRIGGNPFAGFTQLVRSPFLLGIAVFLFFYTSLGSFIYFELKNLLAPYAPAIRTQVQSGINWAINACTILTAVLASGRLAARYGLSLTLAIVPLLMVGGLLAVSVVASVWIVVFAQVALKAGNYAITRPGREMLFTLVDRETRYKAKPIIDTLVYRIGDSLNAWSFTALSQGLGLGMAPLALVGAAIAAAWAAIGVALGRAGARAPATREGVREL